MCKWTCFLYSLSFSISFIRAPQNFKCTITGNLFKGTKRKNHKLCMFLLNIPFSFCTLLPCPTVITGIMMPWQHSAWFQQAFQQQSKKKKFALTGLSFSVEEGLKNIPILECILEVLHWRNVLCRISQMMAVFWGHLGSFWSNSFLFPFSEIIVNCFEPVTGLHTAVSLFHYSAFPLAIPRLLN